jgi:hypothetical protein
MCNGDNPPRIFDALKVLLKLGLIFLAILAGLAFYGVFIYFLFPRLFTFPPGGSTLRELDQAAALAGGLFNLGLTLHGVFGRVWRWNRQNVREAESLLPAIHPHAS